MALSYCTLASIGGWATLEARIETTVIDGSPVHRVDFALVDGHGATLRLGQSVLCACGDPAKSNVVDQGGSSVFPSLDVAIRSAADRILTVTPLPGVRTAVPPQHNLWNG